MILTFAAKMSLLNDIAGTVPGSAGPGPSVKQDHFRNFFGTHNFDISQFCNPLMQSIPFKSLDLEPIDDSFKKKLRNTTNGEFFIKSLQ